ncbi:pathogenesis-related protein [Acrasis kona]|uniref:Pathogenesis-related protein n=1 Tax=Acrasis kona TaxID=1008807 RepID=A0AAW2Z072_9EUKA
MKLILLALLIAVASAASSLSHKQIRRMNEQVRTLDNRMDFLRNIAKNRPGAKKVLDADTLDGRMDFLRNIAKNRPAGKKVLDADGLDAVSCPNCVEFTEVEIQETLEAHNSARAAVNITVPLTWDNDIATFAANYANQCIGTNILAHNPNRKMSDGRSLGENIYASSGLQNGARAVSSWVNEKSNYDYNSNSCAAGKMCGHYTQVVWAKTIKVGCVRVKCNNIKNKFQVLCDYFPPGNVSTNKVKQKPY